MAGPSLQWRPVMRVGWQAFRPAARCTDWRAPALRLRKISTQAARLTKAGSQLPTSQDRKLIELLNPYSTSKPNQLRGLLSE